MKRILIMAGGTGGHIVPGLALAALFRERGCEVSWLGTRRGLESELVPIADIPLSFISISGLRGKGALSLIFAPFRLLFAVLQACSVILKQKPHLIVGMGGFVAGPGGLAAWLLRKPLVIHEQNAVPGLTNRVLARFARAVFEAFPDTFSTHKNSLFTGNPVRKDIAALAPPAERFKNRTGAIRLLILGGSRGAVALNEIVPLAVQQLPEHVRFDIWHQTGADRVEVTEKAYGSENAKVEPFITDMAAAYEWADIVLCRSGASTVTELATVGLGSVLVPYPHAVDDHQTENAKFLANVNAAIIKQQKELTVEWLVSFFTDCDRTQLLSMANAAYSLRSSDAAEKIIQHCLNL